MTRGTTGTSSWLRASREEGAWRSLEPARAGIVAEIHIVTNDHVNAFLSVVDSTRHTLYIVFLSVVDSTRHTLYIVFLSVVDSTRHTLYIVFLSRLE